MTVRRPTSDVRPQTEARLEHQQTVAQHAAVPQQRTQTDAGGDVRQFETIVSTLREVESNFHVQNRIAIDEWEHRKSIAREEWEHRKSLSTLIISSFVKINISILFLLLFIYITETWLSAFHYIELKERIIDYRVIMAIISATTIQFGAIAVGVAGWLFPKSRHQA